jgi:Tol biopolymer transport system component
MKWPRQAIAGLCVILAGVSGCGGATGPQFLLDVTTDGRLERSAVVDVQVRFQGGLVDDSLVQLTADPDNAVQLLSATRARFVSAGPVTLTAEAEVEPGRIERGELTLDVAVPPRIVLDLLRAGNRDVYSMALDGMDLVRLTMASGDDIDPTAAGALVVFTSYRDGNAELYSVPVGGGTAVRLTASAEDETQPALSPDGARLAFATNPSGVPRIWTADSGASGAQAATPGFSSPAAIEASPSWAPTGTRLVFVSTTNGTANLFTVQTGGQPSELLAGSDTDVEPAWSPDGTQVVFASDRTGDGELFLLTIGTGALAQLTNRVGDDGEPAWLPDGRIVYTAFGNGAPSLRWLDPANPAAVFEIPTSGDEARRPARLF